MLVSGGLDFPYGVIPAKAGISGGGDGVKAPRLS